MLKVKNLWSAAALVIVFYAFSYAAGSPIAELKADAGNIEINVPQVKESVSVRSSDSDRAHAQWLEAKKLYSDGTYTPRSRTRIDGNGSKAVMLQGFHWYADNYHLHLANGWWGEIASKASEIGRAGFNLIWIPPVSVGSYYPTQWYNLNSQWGNQENLVNAVKKLHSASVYVVGDMVLNHRNGTTDWYDFTNPDWPSTVITQNDEWAGISALPNNGKSPNYDEGANESGCRDLDHTQKIVQDDTKVFMRWLQNKIGIDGWRYDMVKGYAAYYVGMYNKATMPSFSVGEYFDGNRQLVTNWIDGTDNSGGKAGASSAFDFPTHFLLQSAVESDNYNNMSDNGRPAGLIGWWPAKSVTFVENHDTSPRDENFIANASQTYKDQRLVEYAYILTHPGLPCVFWPHYFDWGSSYKDKLQTLINIRKQAGISSTSSVQIYRAEHGLYAAVIEGDKQRVAVKLGSSWNWQPGEGWTMATNGEKFAVWTAPK